MPSAVLATAAPALHALSWIDGAVILGYLALTTILGARLAGEQATIRDFFLGGRKLPWYAVAGSIVATELSAITFVSVPFMVFQEGGNLTYLQLGAFGALLARLIVAFVLVPAYYQREIYSPYDYMGHRLGEGARRVTSALFALGGILAQASRVYLTAIVLELILRDSVFQPLAEATGVRPLVLAIWAIGAVAVGWTLLGGITTVIWTDVILFLVFVVGSITALVVVATRLDGGFPGMLEIGEAAGKLRFFDTSTDPTTPYTVWTAVFASTIFMTGIYGTDQLMAQRIFCCANAREAKKAVVASWLGQVVTLLVALVGVGLFAYYQAHPLGAAEQALFEERGDRIFPLFILSAIPVGLTGLILAGIFAAAISSLDSILAALSQTTVSTVYVPWRERTRPWTRRPDAAEERHRVLVGRVLVVVFGVLLCEVARRLLAVDGGSPIVELALTLASYAAGPLLAGFLLAFLPTKRDGRGFVFAAPLAVITVVALRWREEAAGDLCLAAGLAILLAWLLALPRWPVRHAAAKTALLALAVLGVVLLQREAGFWRVGAEGEPVVLSLAWPWYAPVGAAVALGLGWLLGNRVERRPGDGPDPGANASS